jgi:hypothetical protein
MDPEANIGEQRYLAAHLLHLQDACSDEGEFTYEQEQEIMRSAFRLAELVQALDAWNRA